MKHIIYIILIILFSITGWWLSDFSKSQKETAIEHSVKHLDEKYQCPMHPDIVKDSQDSCPICGMKLEKIETSEYEKEKEILYWVAPMDPSYRRRGPGKSPMGMDLIPVYSEDHRAISVKIDAVVEHNLGVRTSNVNTASLHRKINTVGYVTLDESRLSHIHLRVDGWIENLAVDVEGERVKKGQRLFDVYSPKLVNAMEEYVQALRSSNNRLKTASEKKLISLGVSQSQIYKLKKDRNIQRHISFYAKDDGIVSMLMVREGMYVKPENRVMSLADLSSIWVRAEIFESQSAWLKAGHVADVKLSYLPGRTWQGKVDYIYPSLDVINRTLKVRLSFKNPNELLKPNMYTNVVIYGDEKDNVLSVPREALIRTGNSERLIVAQGNGKYEQRKVVSGIESDGWIEIKSGISAKERVVISAQFLIDSEASMKASLLRMSDASEKPTVHLQED